MASEIYGVECGGRQPLLLEAETVVNAAIADNPHADIYAAIGSSVDLPLVRPHFQIVPGVLTKGIYRPSEHPDPDIIAELVSRATEIRSRRWHVGEQRVRPLPRDWRELMVAAYPQIPRAVEWTSGWADLMIAATAWINESETDWKFSDAKEKMGSLRLSTHGINTIGGEQIIDAAEHLGSFICQVCGGPGDQGGDFMTLCLEHREDKEWRKTGHV